MYAACMTAEFDQQETSESSVTELPRLQIDRLYRDYRNYVGTIALRILGDVTAADDVVQDVFLTAYRKLSSLRDPNAVKFWLARITVRLARRSLRLRKARRWVGLESLPSAEGIAPGASPEQKAILSSVYTVLHTLPANERIAWTLRHLEGETLPAVAELSGCSLATAKRRISAAQDAIRRSMANE